MKSLLILLLLGFSSFILHGQSSPGSFAYVLQTDSLGKTKDEAIKKLASCDRDWIVLDSHYRRDEPWTAADLTAIRAGHVGRKIIAYLSIGEAEDYRGYWNPKWDVDHDGKPDAGAPDFLLSQNPEWKGNYRVKYWQEAWQHLILIEIDKVTAAGFDGVYLDIVDGFETFEQDGSNFIDNRLNPETKQSYRRDMVDWVETIAARVHKSNPVALIIPQNGPQLLSNSDFLSAIDGIGIEDLFTRGDKLQKTGDSNFVLNCLSPLIASHKPVLDVEYPRRVERKAVVRSLAKQHGFVWTITDRPLKTLGESGR